MSITAIANAHVYDHETGEFKKQTIVINEEKIQAILPPDEYMPTGNLIDASGLYLTPGLIDTCSQIGLKETGIRWEGNDAYEHHEENGLELQVIDGIYPFDKAFNEAVSSGVTAAHIVSAPESVVGAQTAVIHTDGKTVDEMILHSSFGFIFSMGDVPKKAFWDRTQTPLTRMGMALKIKTTLKKLMSAHNLKDTPIFIRAHRADDIATAFRIFAGWELPFILVHGTEFQLASDIPTDLPFSVVAGPCLQPMERGELIRLHPSLYRTFFDQQVPFTFATDHPVSSVTHLQMEGCLAKKAGVPEKSILNSLTIEAARLLKIDQLTGSIQNGLLADLVLWNKHPLDLTARVVKTFIKGKEVYKGE